MRRRMNMNTKFLLAFAAVTSLVTLYGRPMNKLPWLANANDRFTFAAQVNKAPVIDGKLEKEFWDNVPKAKFFQVKKAQTNSVTKQTGFQIAYDEKYLYIGATMWESETSKIKEGSRVQDGWPITDRINFIFSHEYNRKGTYQDSPYIFLMFGAGGIHRGFYNELPGKVEKPLKDESSEWVTAYSKDNTRWYIESRIPLKLLNLTAPKKGDKIFLNVRRDLMTGPASEKQSCWNPFASPALDAHSFGTLYFAGQIGKSKGFDDRINGKPRHWFQSRYLKTLVNKKGEYISAKQKYSNLAGWKEAEDLINKFKTVFDAEFKKDPWTISDQFEDFLMQWKHILNKLENSAPATSFKINTKNAKITSVKLNGIEIREAKGAYPFALVSGVNAIEITAEATGAAPGVKFDLQNSPETASVFSAAAPGSGDKAFKSASVKNGYLWSGDLKKVVFRQNLIWSRDYGNHPMAFLVPHVKVWGVSPGETMNFVHAVFNPLANGKCDYKLIIEIPEGFTRIDDNGDAPRYNHFFTKKIKEEKITYKGKKYVRYTYDWQVPAKLERNMSAYYHLISFRHNGYKFAKGEKVDFRFRRIVNNDTTDIVNVIKVAELPPINGRMLKKILFPQYDPFMGARVSLEQIRLTTDDGFKAGLNSYIVGGDYRWTIGTPYAARQAKIKSYYNRKGAVNFTSAYFNVPMWGAGKQTYLHDFLLKHPELKAKYYQNTGAYVKDFHNEFCPVKVINKYRKEFKEALKKDYQHVAKTGLGNYFFINDENYPESVKHNWTHSYCFCDDCKAGFRAMFKIPATEKLDDDVIVTKYAAQWGQWWRRMQKKHLLTIAYEAIKEIGGKLWYYHNTADHLTYKESKGLYDMLSIPLPGQTYPGGTHQAAMDTAKQQGEKITGFHSTMGQYHTYWLGKAFYSSDSFFYYPKEQKLVMVRMAAITHKGGLLESAAYCSAGTFYYMGEATRLIAAYEDLFHDGVRADNLATSDTFKYPNLLVLKKGDERLVLIFNESQDKAMTGVLRNLKLKPGQKATVWESKQVYPNASNMRITVQPQDVVAVHIK